MKWSIDVGVIAEKKNALARYLKLEAMTIVCRRCEHGSLDDARPVGWV